MNFFTKTRILSGLVILLVTLNLAIVTTVGVRYFKGKEIPTEEFPQQDRSRFIARELNLTPQQAEQFHHLKREHMKRTRELRIAIAEETEKLMRELDSENPDRMLLESMTHRIGLLHAQQQQVTIDHFLKIKEMCTDDQYQRFHQLFRRMMLREPRRMGEMRQHRHRWAEDSDKPENY